MDRPVDARNSAAIGEAIGQQTCPTCGAMIPVLRGYSPWCEACNWNVAPTDPVPKRINKKDQLLERTAGRLTEDRFEAIRRRGTEKPGLSLGGVVVVGLSVIVLALTGFLLFFGIWLVFNGPGFVGLIGGALLIGIAIALRPRLGRMPPALSRDEVPELYGVPDAVAEALEVRPADRIAISSDYNAGVAEVGWRRRRLLILGVPLMASLSPEERVAVLGHEFGHYANGDPLRGTIPSLAIDTLIEWYVLLRPEGIASSPDGDDFHGLLLIPVNLVLLVLSQVPLALAYVIFWLASQNRQRAEYYADLLAARIAGRRAVVSAWTKIHLGETVSAWTRASTDAHWLNRSLWDEIGARVTGLPERELDRARRVELVQRARIDASHPPTYSRIRLVEELGPEERSITIPEKTMADFEAVLRNASQQIQQVLIDR